MTDRRSSSGARRLWRLSGLTAGALVWPGIAGTVTLLSALTLTIVSAWLIVRAWQTPPIMAITVAVTAVRALGISRAVFRYADRLAAHDVALGSAACARVALWRGLTADGGRLARARRGDVLGVLGDDIDALADIIVRALVPMCIAALTSLAAVIFAVTLLPAAGLVLAACLVVSGVVGPWLVYRAAVAAGEERDGAARQYAAAIDRALTHATALRVRGELAGELAAARSASLRIGEATRRQSAPAATGRAVIVAGHVTAILGVLALGLAAYPGGGHSPEWLTVLALLPLAAFEAVMALPAAATSLAEASASLGRLDAWLRDATAEPEPAGTVPDQPDLIARGLVIGHDRDLATVDLELPFGARREIIAESGAGKTTLLMTLAGLLPVRGGAVELREGAGTAPITPEAVRFVAEDEHIFATTVRDNLAIGNPAADDAAMTDLLRVLGLGNWLAGLPGGLGTILDDGADSLSGGQRRRLILARALLSSAPILLLDEPTEHIDRDSDAVLDLLLGDGPLPGARAGRTVVVVRHPRHRS